MRFASIILEVNDLIAYLEQNWRGFDTKDYELLIAIFLAKIHKKQLKEECYISIPILPEAERRVKNEYSKENISEVLKNYIKEDVPVDIVLIPETHLGEWPTDSTRRHRRKGIPFQLKRVPLTVMGDQTEEVLNYLKIIAKTHTPIEAGLLLVVGGGRMPPGQINLSQIAKKFSPPSFPYKNALFITNHDDTIIFGQLWPNVGFTKHDMSFLFSD